MSLRHGSAQVPHNLTSVLRLLLAPFIQWSLNLARGYETDAAFVTDYSTDAYSLHFDCDLHSPFLLHKESALVRSGSST